MLVEYISYGLMESLSVFTRLPLGLPGRSGGSGRGRGGKGRLRDFVNVV